MKIKNLNRLILKVLISTTTAFAGNSLYIVKSDMNTLDIRLRSTEEVAGIQFSLNASSDIKFENVERGNLTIDPHWIVDFYKPNDSTLNMVILSLRRDAFLNIEGTLAKINFLLNYSSNISYVKITNVMFANNKADSVGVIVNGLTWDNTNPEDKSSNNIAKLGQNYPNPFNPTTRIAYTLNKAAHVKLCIYDLTGREVSRLVDNYQEKGNYSVEWNSYSKEGIKLSSGIYIARLNVENQSFSQKMIMTK